jgi:hypothetical protein
MLLYTQLFVKNSREQTAKKLCGDAALTLKTNMLSCKRSAKQKHTVKAGKTPVLIIYGRADLSPYII